MAKKGIRRAHKKRRPHWQWPAEAERINGEILTLVVIRMLEAPPMDFKGNLFQMPDGSFEIVISGQDPPADSDLIH